MLKKVVLLALSLLFNAQFLSAQKSFVPGYVVTQKGDTLKGFIDDNLSKKSSIVSFRLSLDQSSTVETLTPDELQAVYLKPYNEYYVSRIIQIDKKPVDIIHLENNPAPKYSIDSIFLKVIVKGNLSLYQYTESNNKDHFFAQKGDGEINELSFIQYMLVGQNRMVTLDLYKDQLRTLTCNNLKKLRTESVSYNLISLRKFFNRYNELTGQESKFVEKRERIKLLPYLTIGYSLDKMKFNGLDNSPYGAHLRSSNAVFNNSNSPVIGGGIDWKGRGERRFFFNLELLYKHASFQNFVKTTTDETLTQLKYSYLRFNYTGKYFLIRKGIPVFLRVGLTNGISFNDTNNITVSRPSVGDVVYNGPASDFQKYDIGGIGGIGVKLTNISFELRYEYVKKSGKFTNASMDLNSFYFVASYSFRR